MKELKIIAASALDALKNSGADIAYVTALRSRTQEFNIDKEGFKLLRSLFDSSLELTAIKDGKRGSAEINSFEDEKIAQAVSDCFAALESGQSDPDWEIAPGLGCLEFSDGCPEPDMEALFFRSRELYEDIKRDYPLVVLESMVITHKSNDEVYANSNGSVFRDVSGKYHVNMSYSAHSGEKGSSFFYSSFSTDKLDEPFISNDSVRRGLEDIQKQIFTKNIGGKLEGTVIFTPDCASEVLYYALSSFAGAEAIQNKTSPWLDKLGKPVADESLTVSLAPRDAKAVCGVYWTPDGYLTEDYNMIDNGVLKGFFLDKYFSNKTGFERSPNTCVSHMCVRPGRESSQSIISGIESGLMVSRISGGTPGASGEFSMVAKNSFLIENGKIGDAVSEVTINGNLLDLLKNIRAISSNTEADGSGNMPWIAFDGVTIAGK